MTLITTDDFEQYVVDSLVKNSAPFSQAADFLTSHVLSTVGDFAGRPTDGVIFEWEDWDAPRASGFGIVVLIGSQCVEPLRIEVVLDDSLTAVATGQISFGDSRSGEIKYGSRSHTRMVKQIIAYPHTEFPWKAQFRRESRGWRRFVSVAEVLNRGKSFRSDESFDVSLAAIAHAESTLRFTFPHAYRDFLDLGGLNELNIEHRILSPAEIVAECHFVSSHGLIPFASDSCGGLYCWSTDPRLRDGVLYWNHENDAAETVFGSFLSAIDSWRRG